jgi:hypothetical protein
VADTFWRLRICSSPLQGMSATRQTSGRPRAATSRDSSVPPCVGGHDDSGLLRSGQVARLNAKAAGYWSSRRSIPLPAPRKSIRRPAQSCARSSCVLMAIPPNGKAIYYQASPTRPMGGLYVRALTGGPEKKIRDSTPNRGYAITSKGIYYVGAPATESRR